MSLFQFLIYQAFKKLRYTNTLSIYPQMLTWLDTHVDIMFFEKTHLHPQVIPRNLHQAKGIFQSVSQLAC